MKTCETWKTPRYRICTYRAARVTVILRTSDLTGIDHGEQVLGEHGRLSSDGRGGLARRQARAVADSPHVSEIRAGVPKRRLVDRNPTSLVRNRRALQGIERAHGRGDVQKRVVDVNRAVRGLECRLVRIRVDPDEVVCKVAANAALLTERVQCIRVLLHAEHGRHARVEVNGDRIAAPSALVPVPGHPHNLLRGCTPTMSERRGRGRRNDIPPAHLITPAGWVKMALPDRSASTSLHTLSQVL